VLGSHQAVAYIEWLKNYVPGEYVILSQKNNKPVDEFGNELKDA